VLALIRVGGLGGDRADADAIGQCAGWLEAGPDSTLEDHTRYVSTPSLAPP